MTPADDAPSAVMSPLPPPRPPAHGWWRETVELLSSMRFAIALLTLIGIASIAGTVVKQHEPAANYVNQFGPFWAPVFEQLGLYAVYSAPWFLLILAFLVISTSLCVARNTPKIVADLKTFKESVRVQSLQAFHHRAQGEIQRSPQAVLSAISAVIGARGWKAKVQTREQGLMVAARQGAANKLGYVAAHSAIVLICLGGLLDSDLIVKALMRWRGVTAFEGSGMVREVPAEHRLPQANPTFRGNMWVREGQRTGVALLNQSDGVVLQDLPFEIELKKFHVEFYSTGMPKLFASDVVIHDRSTGVAREATVKVNEPAYHAGVAIYQSSFEDGGSSLKLQAHPLGKGTAFEVSGEVGSAQSLLKSQDAHTDLTLELTGLRVFNVENFAQAGAVGEGTDVRKVDLMGAVNAHLGSGTRVVSPQDLRNIGPSVSYKLRDAAGQAHEFNNYMSPVELEGQRVFLAGVRDTPAEPFRYLRIPADEQGRMDTWLGARQALLDPVSRQAAVQRYVQAAVPPDQPALRAPLSASAQRALEVFAEGHSGEPDRANPGGLMALSAFVERSVPAEEQAKASEMLVRVLNGTLFELTNLSRERQGLSALAADESTQGFMMHMVLSLSDAAVYPAPYLLQLQTFDQVQASVFQLTRSPGKVVVYTGCMALIIGVFAMLYVRERRLWIWLQAAPEDAARTSYVVALSSTRRSLDTDREFEALREALRVLEAPSEQEKTA